MDHYPHKVNFLSKLHRFALREVTSAKLFFLGLSWVSAVMLGSFASRRYSLFRAHDFLDSIVTLSWLAATPEARFKPDAELPLLFGGDVVPIGALGFSDFSISHLFYFLLPLELAPVASEFLGRLLLFVGAFLLFQALVPSGSRPSSGPLLAGVSLALMPFWPTITWTLVSLLLTTYAMVLLGRSGQHRGAYVLLTFSPQLAFFAWGGFLIPAIVFFFLLFRSIQRTGFLRYFVAFLLATVSTGLSAYGLIRVWLGGDFVSHRSEWSRESGFSGADYEWIGSAMTLLTRTFLAGQYHYGTFFSWAPNAVWEGVNTFVVLVALLAGPVIFFVIRRRGILTVADSDAIDRTRALTIVGVSLLAVQATVSLIYVAETSGLASFASLLGIPFQFNRVVSLSPIVWALLAGVSYSMFEWVLPPHRRRAIGAVALVMVTLQGFVVNPSIGGFMRELVPNLDNLGAVSVAAYFQQNEYRSVASRLEGSPKPLTALSIGLDPMVAVAAGIPSLDGYVYNFPLSHKQAFRDLLLTSPLVGPKDIESFDAWGSRLYLPPDTGKASSRDIDWCLARAMGADIVLAASRDLRSKDLTYLFSEGTVHVFEISVLCGSPPMTPSNERSETLDSSASK